ncbi:MAG: hypothetical protein AAGN35_09955 [Bacteroidota bacterium]
MPILKRSFAARLQSATLGTILLFCGCNERIFEIQPVITVADISLGESADVLAVCFPTPTIGWAITDTATIYRTTDGGSTWNSVSAPNDNLTYIAASSPLIAVLAADGRIYHTLDGGATWNDLGSGDYVGRTPEGTMVYLNCDFTSCQTYISRNGGQTFSSSTLIQGINAPFRDALIAGEFLYVVSDRSTDDVWLRGVDLATGTLARFDLPILSAGEFPNGLYRFGNRNYMTGPLGNLWDGTGDADVMRHDWHTFDFYDVDGTGDLVIAVGEQCIATNLNLGTEEYWNPVLDESGNGFPHTFYDIQYIDSETFVVTGDRGLIWRAQL